jgi:biotin-dependent carboxylase-like uncharacterized protein
VSALRVARAAGLVTVQDGGRPGHLHEGVPVGGALVPELLARANAVAGNAWGEAALEIFGAIEIVASGALLVASDDGQQVKLADGGSFALASAGARVRYLAVRGGLDVPRQLGGRGTLLGASLGGWQGRAVRRGDTLPVGGASAAAHLPLPPAPDPAASVRVVPGPDLDRVPEGALQRLLGGPFAVDPRSDRVGIRLAGPGLGGARQQPGPSAPMVRGAIQLPPDGTPIVLGPDHPTTGGYPVVAVVVRADLGLVGALPVGAPVRFAASEGRNT